METAGNTKECCGIGLALAPVSCLPAWCRFGLALPPLAGAAAKQLAALRTNGPNHLGFQAARMQKLQSAAYNRSKTNVRTLLLSHKAFALPRAESPTKLE